MFRRCWVLIDCIINLVDNIDYVISDNIISNLDLKPSFDLITDSRSKDSTGESHHEDRAAVHSTMAGKHWKATWDCVRLYLGI